MIIEEKNSTFDGSVLKGWQFISLEIPSFSGQGELDEGSADYCFGIGDGYGGMVMKQGNSFGFGYGSGSGKGEVNQHTHIGYGNGGGSGSGINDYEDI